MRNFFLASMLSISALHAHEQYQLEVSGTGHIFLKATKADIRFGIEVEGLETKKVEGELTSKLNRVLTALKKGSYDKLETTSFTIYPEYSSQNPREIKGYRGKAEVLGTTDSIHAGSLIALAIDSGATGVNGIDLKASDPDVLLANKRAVALAANEAKAIALAALEALHLSFESIENVSINPKQSFPVPYRAALAFDKSNAGPILEAEQQVTAEVALKIRFKALE